MRPVDISDCMLPCSRLLNSTRLFFLTFDLREGGLLTSTTPRQFRPWLSCATWLLPMRPQTRKTLAISEQTSSSAIAETALQGALVLAKSGRLELGDNILRTL